VTSNNRRESTQIQQCKYWKKVQGKESFWDKDLTCEFFWFLWTIGNGKHTIKLTDQPGNLIPLDRAEVPDLSVSGW
jgi:hypothetical protein